MILVTGGSGFIGSHTCVQLLENGYDVLVVDNLCNSSRISLDRVEQITGKKPVFVNADMCNLQDLDDVFKTYKIDSVIHFAGLKAVGESVSIPDKYFDNNLNSTLNLCKCMKKYGVKKLVFSSSATVYSQNNTVPLKETSNTGDCTNPYGWTKYMIEQILKSYCVADKDLSVVLLRYFNPVGAHKSGLIGEDPNGMPNNLMPYISMVAVGKLECLTVFGNDYDTVDGSGVRDYIHVVDLACAHLSALKFADNHKGCEVFNIGTGKGTSVLELVKAFEQENGVKVPYRIGPRRPGDLATVFSDCSKAKLILGFETKYDIKDMCRDCWKWQKNNPNGYR